MKKIILSLLVAFGLSTSALAVSLEGLSVGVSMANGGFYGIGEETSDNKRTGVDHPKQAGAFEAEFASVFVEYDVGPMSVGVDWIFETIETPKNKNVQVTSDTDQTLLNNEVHAEFENHITLYGLLKSPLDGLLGGLYLKAGVIMVDINSLETLETGGAYPDVDTTGITAGLGYAVDAGNGVSLRVEATAAEYDNVSAENQNNSTTNVYITDMMSAKANVSLVYSF